MHEQRPGMRQHSALHVSRRKFMQSTGALAATSWIGTRVEAGIVEASDGIRRAGPGEVPCELKINGQAHKVMIEPRTTLLDVLRDKLELTGTKDVCGRGACGGCTVHLDGMPVNACLTLALDAVDVPITTVEGLAKGEKLSPLQQAFCKHDALQCGFCTSGFLMSLDALLTRCPKPTVHEIADACSGNLCRCGTYPKIFEAVQSAAGADVPRGNVRDNAGKALENEQARVDAPLKVSGRARYTADIRLPRMVHARIISCPYGHARIDALDIDAARAIDGVLNVSIHRDKEFIYCGQPVGHICAHSTRAIDDALAALNLKWEILDPTTDPIAEHERVAGSIPPPLEDAKGTRGDLGTDQRRAAVKDIFAKTDKIIERTFRTQIQTHACLEPHCAVADCRSDRAEIWCSSQGTSATLAAAAEASGLDRSSITVHCEHVGGGFGSKLVGLGPEGKLAVELSRKLGRPVQVINDRQREHLDTGCRPGSIQYMRMATDEGGKPLGGYVYVAGVNGPEKQGGGTANPSRYDFGPVFKSFIELGLTTGGARPMRAPGHPQGMFAVEGLVDELAAAAGVDPLEYRKRIETSDVRKRMYDVGAEAIGWKNRPASDADRKGRIRRGIGMAVGDWPTFEADAQIRIDVFKDGTARVYSGTQDIGTGTRTVLVDTLADHLGIARELISSDCGNSSYPPGPSSGGSMTVHSIVPAIRDTGDQAAAQLRKLSGTTFEDTESWKAACKKIPGESFTVVGSKNPKYWGQGGTEAVQFVEVEVDVETGIIRPLRVVALQNCGQSVNRLTAENQIIGGVIQGLSFALFEEKILDGQLGGMVNPNLEQYKILGPRDCPEIRPIIWREAGEDGARSLGEPPTIPTAGATANAVTNALGVRIFSLPMTPSKVLAALGGNGGER